MTIYYRVEGFDDSDERIAVGYQRHSMMSDELAELCAKHFYEHRDGNIRQDWPFVFVLYNTDDLSAPEFGRFEIGTFERVHFRVERQPE